MITKRPFKIVLISFLGLLISLWNFIIAFGDKRNSIFIIIALIYLFLGIGIFLLSNRVRIFAIIFSILTLIIYIQLLYFGIKGIFIGGKSAFLAAGFIFNFPIFIFSLLVLDTLTRGEFKEIFK